MINLKRKESVALRVIIIMLLFVAGISNGSHKTAAIQTTNDPAQAIQNPPELPLSNYSVDLGDGIEMDMVWIPAGSFMMRSPASKAGRFGWEGPQAKVSVEGFWIGKFEVTQAQYEAIMETNPSQFKGENNPVEKVSWNDAMEFSQKLSTKTGQHYVLPTEAQWEYACQGGTTTAYSFGNDANQLGNYAWWSDNSGNTTHPVGQKQPNSYGLYDMHGNVWEWCLSLYKPYPYSETDGRNDLSDTTSVRVLRGGDYGGGGDPHISSVAPMYIPNSLYGLGGEPSRYFRYAYRLNYNPDYRSCNSGFRCARPS